jgi:hypothetical protein
VPHGSSRIPSFNPIQDPSLMLQPPQMEFLGRTGQSLIVTSFQILLDSDSRATNGAAGGTEELEIFKGGGVGRSAGWPLNLINQFELEGGKEAFSQRVVSAITAPAHGGAQGHRNPPR